MDHYCSKHMKKYVHLRTVGNSVKYYQAVTQALPLHGNTYLNMQKILLKLKFEVDQLKPIVEILVSLTQLRTVGELKQSSSIDNTVLVSK